MTATDHKHNNYCTRVKVYKTKSSRKLQINVVNAADKCTTNYICGNISSEEIYNKEKMIMEVIKFCRHLWENVRRFNCKTSVVVTMYLMSVQVASETTGGKSFQRRFLWKQMDNTVDDLMLGVMSGARVVRGMLSAPPHIRHTGSPYDYMPSEATRIKYIIRSPMKMIKFHPPKKTIKVMNVPKPYIEGKFFKPKIKFPTSEELRKLEKEQELMAEGRMPMKTSEELMAEIESEKHIREQNTESETQKTSEELAAEREAEKVFAATKQTSTTADHTSEIIKSGIQEFHEDWLPIQHRPEAKPPSPFSTSRSYPLSKLHTTIIDSYRPESEQKYITTSYPVSKLHTSIIDSLRPEPTKDIYQDSNQIQRLPEDPPKRKPYEVTEITSEEMPEYNPSTQTSVTTEGRSKLSVKVQSTGTTSTTTEEPNYPEEFLRKYRQRTTAVTPPTSQRLRTSSSTPSDTGERNKNIAPLDKNNASRTKTNSLHTRTNTVKWPPDVPEPRPFGTQAALIAEESRIQSTIASTSEAVRTIRKKKVSPKLTVQKSTGGEEIKTFSNRDTRQRGNIRFGDKLNLDETH